MTPDRALRSVGFVFLLAAAITNPSQITFTQDSSQPSRRSLALKLAEIVSAKDPPFNAAGDGVTDDTTAINACMTAAIKCALPPGTYLISGALTPTQDGQCLVGAGASSTLYYTGSGDAILWTAPRRSGCMRDLAIRFDTATGATATAIHIQGSNAGSFRFTVDNVQIYRGTSPAALFSPVTGQTGILIDSTGSSGGWFSHFSNLWMAGIDAPVNCTSTCNQNHFSNIQFEQYGSGTNAYGFNLAGNNNTVTNATFSRGGSTATNVWGFFLNGGTYNVLHGSADVGTGGLWTGTLGTTNSVNGSDSSTAALTAFFGQQIQLGPTPATVGAVRMSNNTSISWRNGANSADVGSVTLDASDRLKIGTSAAFVRLNNQIMEFGTGTVASAGLLRAAHATDFRGRNSANNANRVLWDWGVAVADVLSFGDPNSSITLAAPLTAFTNATLGTPANGFIRYCSDCTIANPCAGGGTGALAKRLNGVWVCN